jgi:hypothetical protein
LSTFFHPQVTPPAEIDDPTDSKPADWVDEAKIPEPGATKPEDWDEEAPKTVEDASAEKPEGWEDEEAEVVADPTARPPEDWYVVSTARFLLLPLSSLFASLFPSFALSSSLFPLFSYINLSVCLQLTLGTTTQGRGG